MKKIIDKIKYVLISAKEEANIIEIIFWWVARALLLYAAIKEDSSMQTFLFCVNLAATFVYDVIRLFAARGGFFARVTFHAQTIVAFMGFFCFYLGHATDIFSNLPFNKDHLQHVVAGVTMVLGGYLFSKAADKKNQASATMHVLSSTGFSFFTMVIWEIFEFWTDYYIEGSNNQNFRWEIPDDMFLFRVFGPPQAGQAQYPVMDTMIDMGLATIFTAITAIVLYAVLKSKENKKSLKKHKE